MGWSHERLGNKCDWDHFDCACDIGLDNSLEYVGAGAFQLLMVMQPGMISESRPARSKTYRLGGPAL